MASRAVGFVYVLTNREMPGLVKVGMTRDLPEDRARNLQSTGVPVNFDVAFRAATSWEATVEKKAKVLLAPYRVAPNREFFRTSAAIAIDAIREAAARVAGIEAWTSPPVHHLGSGDRVALTLTSGQIFAVIAYPNLLSRTPDIIDLWQVHSDGNLLEIFVTHDPGYVSGLSDNDPAGDIDPVPYLNRDSSAPNGNINGKERLVPGDRLLWLSMPDGASDCTSALFEMTDYAQVVGRTWTPRTSVQGFPLTLNDFTLDAPPRAMVDPIRAALDLPFPRSWAPRDRNQTGVWAPIGTSSPVPSYWVPQLNARPKRPPSKRGKRASSSDFS